MKEMFKELDDKCWAIKNKKGCCVKVLDGVKVLQAKFGISHETARAIVQEWVWARF